MLYLRLPFFLLYLAIKNAESWSRIFIDALGAQLLILFLIAFNLVFGSLLYLELQKNNQLTHKLQTEQEKLDKHRAFWQKILDQFPTHKTAVEAEKILKTAE